MKSFLLTNDIIPNYINVNLVWAKIFKNRALINSRPKIDL